MQFNFFNWVRDGVKQAVLLGVSDAVETIGTPLDDKTLSERLQAAMEPRLEAATVTATAKVGGTTKRKRLGRTLKDIDGSEES
jgi:hypothetical protein